MRAAGRPGAARRRPTRLAASFAALLALAALVGAARAETVRLGNLIVSIDGSFSPKKLPKQAPAPITLKLSGSIKTVDGSVLWIRRAGRWLRSWRRKVRRRAVLFSRPNEIARPLSPCSS